ncbi:unnamed protein product [Lactuca saligna]|uniref:DUF8039 domain-containing protein n=1 Tax=Lactuca saligna TaxID=75948 RepID=A0AA35ZWP2_LACSI|nr:unnamed protein product [Lactuca saligna]
MSKYDHRMGRGGYTTLRRKLIEENVISKEEIPPRSMEHEKQIKEGQVNFEPVTDATTLVLGKEKGRFLKGVGTGVTYNRYFKVPRSKGSSKEEIKDLKVALHNGKLELEKKDVEHKALSTKVISKPNKKPIQTKSVTTTPDAKLISMKSATANTKTTNKTVKSKTTTINHDIPKVSPNNPIHQPIKCSLSYPYKRNIVSLRTIHLSSERQLIHGVPLQDDCYKVSIDEVVVKTAFLPHQTGELKLVEDAYKSFAPWPKYLVQTESEVCFNMSNTFCIKLYFLHTVLY